MSLHFAHGRSILNTADWSIATSSGGNLTSQSLYFSLQAANPIGKNLILKSDLINIAANQKITFTINETALRSGEGWTHYVIGVSSTNDLTTFKQIAKIPIYAKDINGNVDFNSPNSFPLTLTITKQSQLTTGQFVETLPTVELVNGMVRGVDDPDNFIYEYDSDLNEWIKISSFSTYIYDVYYEGGCAIDISQVGNFDYIKPASYIPNGTNSSKIRYFLKNDSGFEIPAGTSIKILVDIDGYDKSKLFDNMIFYTIKGFSLENECLLRTVYLESGQPLDFIDFEQTHTAAFPTLNLKDKVRVGESVYMELYVNFHEQDFAGQIPQGNISIIPQFTKSVATYNPVGSLFEKGIIYSSYNRKRVTPGVGLSVNVAEGEGLVKKYFFFQPKSTLTSFAANTANQKVYINRSGITYIDTQERDDTLLRAIVDTTSKESHVGEWCEYAEVVANKSLYLTVNYPCDVNLIATVRDDYPDVLANNTTYFNVKKINFYVQRLSDGEIRKFTNNLVAAGEPQNFTLNDWSAGTISIPPTTKVSFFNPANVTFVSSNTGSDLISDSYRVCYSFVYEGDVVSDISHSVALGCVKEAERDLADVTTSDAYNNIAQIKELTNVFDGERAYLTTTDATYVYNATNDEDNDDLNVLEPNNGVGRWLNATRHKANKPHIDIVAPLITNDTTEGYVVGDKWLNTITGKEYTLIDTTEDNAVWKQLIGGETIELSANVTWYVATDGDANNDGLTVDTPITLEEAVSRVFNVVPTDNNYVINIELADGNYNNPNEYTFVHPDTEFRFDIKIHGQDWVGTNAYPTVSINYLKFVRFYNYSYLENVYYSTLQLVNSSFDIKNVAASSVCRITEYNGYAYVYGVYKFGGVNGCAFSVTGGYLDLDDVTFDAGGITRNFTQGFVRIGYAGGLNIASTNTIVGTFTGKKIDFINAEAILDGDEANFATIPGDIEPVYPTYIFAPSNTLATTNSLSTVATTGNYEDLSGKPTLGTASSLNINVADGVCTLDANGKVSSTYLPSYVDDVIEYVNLAGFPVTGETAKIYIALDSNRTYRWSGSVYIEVSNPFSGSYNDLTNKPTLGTAAALDVGTTANKVVQLDGTGKLPAVDGSLLTNLPGGDAASDITVDTSSFSTNLSSTDTTVQAALETLDQLVAGGVSGTDGASAYQIAVANGFVGTESAWLASLVGAQGNPGVDGVDGATGSVSAASGLTLDHITTPSAPDTNKTIVYAKADNKLYYRPSGGSETEVVSSTTFADTVFRIQDNTDNTKQIAFEASNITTGTTRTLTVPDANGTIALTSNLTNYAPLSSPINAQTGVSYTLVLSDAHSIITMNNVSANTLTIPTNATVAFPIGTVIEIWRLSATTTIDATTGVTLNGVSGGNTTISAAYAPATLRKIGTDIWLVATGGAASVA